MGRKKQSTVQRSVRFPADLFQILQDEADLHHGGDFTSAVIFQISKARVWTEKEKRWIREGSRRDKGESPAPRRKKDEREDP
jgi:hypothetical protein